MPQRYRAAVHVDPVGREPQLLHQRHRLHRESLVQLVEIYLLALPAGFSENLLHRRLGGHHHPFGFHTGGGVGHHLGLGRNPVFRGRRLRQDHHGRSTVVHPWGIPSGDGAIRFEGGSQLRQHLHRSIPAGSLVGIEHQRVPLLLGNLHRHDLSSELAAVHGGESLPVAVGRIFILHPAGYVIPFGNVFPGTAHVVVLVNVPEAVPDHRIDDLAVPHPVPLTGIGEEVRSIAHALHSSGNHHLLVSQHHRLGRQDHRLEAGAADFIDGQGGHRARNAPFQSSLTGRILPQARLDHVPHYHFSHSLRGNPRATDRLLDDVGPQLRSLESLHGPEEFTNGSPNGARDEGFRHGMTSLGRNVTPHGDYNCLRGASSILLLGAWRRGAPAALPRKSPTLKALFFRLTGGDSLSIFPLWSG